MTKMQTTPVPVLTIDGPSGAGKGAVAAGVARHLGWQALDSGAVYRAVAVSALDQGVSADDVDALVVLCGDLPLSFEAGDDGIRVFLAGRAIDARLRQEEVSTMSSKIASQPAVRAALMDLQRSFRQPPGLVADGRDMGTVVFPDAQIKVFLDASVEERANRRYKQLKEKGKDVNFLRLFRDLEARDRRDRERSVSPTVPAADAEVIDSTAMTLEAVIDRVLSIARQRV